MEVGEAKEGMIHKKAERTHLEDHVKSFTSWGKLMTWELTTGGNAAWEGENKFSLARVKCVNKDTP